ncbi:MAG: hypothetical protein WA230_15985 [Xanthobacteraceae bacterium]
MVAALEFVGIARVVRDDERATVSALIVDDPDFTLSIAHQYDRFGADKGSEIVARLFHLAFVADIDPGNAKNPLELKLENGWIGINLPVDARWLHE